MKLVHVGTRLRHDPDSPILLVGTPLEGAGGAPYARSHWSSLVDRGGRFRGDTRTPLGRIL